MMFQLNFRTSHPLPPIIFMSEVGGSSSILLVKMVIITNMMARRTLFFSPKKSGFRPENLFFFRMGSRFVAQGRLYPSAWGPFWHLWIYCAKKIQFFSSFNV